MKINCVGEYIEHLGNQSQVNHHEFFKANYANICENSAIQRFLNKKDIDILYLYFIAEKKQLDLQEILNRTQPSLCYDIKRIRERIELILYLQCVFDIFLNFLETRQDMYEDYEVDILVLLFYTTSYSYTSRVLQKKYGISVRYAFDKLMRKLLENEHYDIYEIFLVISRNKNKIKRVYEKSI